MVVWALQDRLDVNCKLNNFVSIFTKKPKMYGESAPLEFLSFTIPQWKSMCRYKLPKTPIKIKLFAKKAKYFP